MPGFGGLAGGSALPEVSWQVKDWVATRTLRNPSEVPLQHGASSGESRSEQSEITA